MVLTENTTHTLQLLAKHFQRLSLLPLLPQEARKVKDGGQRGRVLIPQRAPFPSQSLTVEWLGITQLALVTQQNRQVVDDPPLAVTQKSFFSVHPPMVK